MTVFRGCHDAKGAALVDAMRSNYEVGRPAHPADLRATVLHMAVSMFEDAEFDSGKPHLDRRLRPVVTSPPVPMIVS